MTDHEGIDYLYNSKKRVELAITTDQGDAKALLVATIAQAEATIAVAEELRTANLQRYMAQTQEARDRSRVAGEGASIVDEWIAGQYEMIRDRLGMER